MQGKKENTREPISKKTRFEVFKRDAFTCQYCGATPPDAVLEIDHIQPVSKGGTSSINNLLAACFSCNRGKSDRLLDVAPESLQTKAEILQEKREQLKAYERLLKKISADQEKQVDAIQSVFQERFPGYSFADQFRRSIKINFLTKLPAFQIREAMALAISKSFLTDNEKAIKYFCAVCWNMIRGQE